ncbi:MAG TPA: HGxxPAAW family protein [Streptosporangiaceae bacterium]
MAEQATGTVEGTGTTGALAHGPSHLEHNPGRPISWVGTVVVIIGFIIGGIAFVPKPDWIVFWIGTGVAIVGCLILLFSKAMSTDWY